MRSINEMDRLDAGILAEIRKAVSDCVDSGWYILGRNVARFEEEFARYLGCEHCVAVANGTDALEIALRALGVEAGDEVVTIANAGFYGSIGILACGAEPAYVDIDPETYTMSPASLESRLSGRTKAVILTHLYGRMADVKAIGDICASRGVPMIEDCAQAHGARLQGRAAGSFGSISCFSFYPTKNLGAMGDGGALATSDPVLAERIRLLRQYGWQGKYNVGIPHGKNSRLDEIQAAVLSAKLPHLDRWNQARRAIADRYDRGIANPGIARKRAKSGEEYVAHLYVIESEDREGLRAYLKEHGVPCDVHYPIPDHRQKRYNGKYSGLRLENTERASERVLTLPCFPEMTEAETDFVIEALNRWRS